MIKTLTRVLRFGSRGDDVAQIQAALNQLPSTQASLLADGIYGTETASGVQEFQRQNQLSLDGIFGPNSFAMLLKLLGDILCTPPGVALTDANFIDLTKKAWSPQPFVGGKKKSWCGIFCVYCYRKAGLKTLKWNTSFGAPTGPIKLNSWSRQFVPNIKLADMGAVATQQHHFLIEKVAPNNPHTPGLETIDANLLAGRIRSLS